MQGDSMLIESLFKKKIDRYISGVVKVQDLDQTKTYQELDEYVVTGEVQRLLSDFFSAFNKTATSQTEDMGVWISGFFGSGKSHFLKVLYYLLTNNKVVEPESGTTRLPYEIFKDKELDNFLTAEIHRAATAFRANTILFNVQSKEKPGDGKHAVLNVFLRVFNDMQGFFEAQPWVAELERQLVKKGGYDAFRTTYAEKTGKSWEQSREAVSLYKKDTVYALSSSLRIAETEADAWLTEVKNKYSVSTEEFANLVQEYLESKGPQARVVFLVDEVGQFIGERTDLMLSLQTIAEELGVKCRGRAWVIVTSQEELDSIIGDQNRRTVNDFSKIQGRFKTRLSLSSANVDKVIKSRILDKTETATAKLSRLFEEKQAILKNLLSFSSDCSCLPQYDSATSFCESYPFAPYQFSLLQKAYTEIRKTGATGKHLAHGERSMLDGFQSAAVAASKNKQQVGILIPFYAFYDSIENSLDGSIKATIFRVAAEPSLVNPFDCNILKLLFLIKGSDKDLPPTVENISTLCLTNIEQDKLQLKKDIEASLLRLEKAHHIRRNDDLYYFLSDEEQEIQREVARCEFDAARASKELGNMIFDEILSTRNSYRYAQPKSNLRCDYRFNRICDNCYLDGRQEELSFRVLTPFGDDYQQPLIHGTTLCGMSSSVVLKIEQGDRLEREFTTWLKTQTYCERPSGSVSESRRIYITDLENQNRQRRKRLVTILSDALKGSEVFTCGKVWSSPAISKPKDIFDQSFAYMVENTYHKLSLMRGMTPDPEKELVAILTEREDSNLFKDSVPHPEATTEVLAFIESQAKSSKLVHLNDLVDRYTSIPYGWPDWEVVLIIARLMHRKDLVLLTSSHLSKKEAIPYLTKKNEWKKLKVELRQKISTAHITQVAQVAKELFSGATPPEGEEALYSFFHEKMRDLHEELKSFEGQIVHGGFPGREIITQGITLLDRYLAQQAPSDLVTTLLAEKDSIRKFQEAYQDVRGFLTSQTANWNELKRIEQRYTLNAWYLDAIPEVKSIFEKAQSILASPSPYSQLQKSTELCRDFERIESPLLAEHRASATDAITKVKNDLAALASELKQDDVIAVQEVLRPFGSMMSKVEATAAIAELKNYEVEAESSGEVQARKLRSLAKPKDTSAKVPQREQVILDPRTIWERGQLIETEEDIENYLCKLRATLREALKRGNVSLR